MATVTFGLSQSYDWTSTYWSTLTNVQGTRKSGLAADDGWMCLDFRTADATQVFDNLTGWNTGGATVEIDPAGQLHIQLTSAGNTHATDSDWAANDASYSWFAIVKYDVPATYDADANGFCFNSGNSSRGHVIRFINDSGSYKVYCFNNSTNPGHTTTAVCDSSEWTILGIGCNNVSNAVRANIHGIEQFADGETYGSGNRVTAIYNFKHASETNSPEFHVDKLVGFDGVDVWETTDGVLESDATAAVYDAGAGGTWTQVDWTEDTSNSTTITYEVRCAATSGGLAAASYETIAATGDPIVSQDRYIQVKITLADASAGVYTPVVKTLTLTNAAAAVAGGTAYLRSKAMIW